MAEQASMPLGAAAWMAIRIHGGNAIDLQGALSRVYMTFGIQAWSFLERDEDTGTTSPVAINREDPDFGAILDRLLPFAKGGMEVAEAGDALYSDAVITPLVQRQSKRSRAGQTTESTSLSPDGGSPPPTPLRRSSPTRRAAG
jgi:hypothetical protein